jgi:adenylate cyclase
LAVLGDGARAREWGERAILIDPENLTTRYNLACGFAQLNDTDGMLELLEPYFEQGSLTQLIHALVDPDLDAIRRDPRLLVMVRAAMARLDARPEMLPAEARNLLAAD